MNAPFKAAGLRDPFNAFVCDDDTLELIRVAAADMGWPTEKCNRYRKAYDQSVARLGKKGLGAEFLASHDAFLASNCQARAEVCARSKEELDLANRLVVLAMNSGMSSTFLPFNCRS